MTHYNFAQMLRETADLIDRGLVRVHAVEVQVICNTGWQEVTIKLVGYPRDFGAKFDQGGYQPPAISRRL